MPSEFCLGADIYKLERVPWGLGLLHFVFVMFRITTISRHAARCILPAVRQQALHDTTRHLRTVSVPLSKTASLRRRSIPERIHRRTFASAAADAKEHDITVLPATEENGLTISDRALKVSLCMTSNSLSTDRSFFSFSFLIATQIHCRT